VIELDDLPEAFKAMGKACTKDEINVVLEAAGCVPHVPPRLARPGQAADPGAGRLHGGAAANAAPVLLDFDDFAGVVLEMLKFKSVQASRSAGPRRAPRPAGRGGSRGRLTARAQAEKDEEALGAFVTLGGGMEGEKVQAEALRDFVKQFELAIDIDALIRSVDSDGHPPAPRAPPRPALPRRARRRRARGRGAGQGRGRWSWRSSGTS
jgi:hypothetical protein